MIKVVTGAGASGKSSFAESLLEQSEAKRKIYAATMIVWDDECRARVKKHRQMREKKGFETAERPVDLGGLFVAEDGAVLVECMSNLAANEMFKEKGTGKEEGTQKEGTGKTEAGEQQGGPIQRLSHKIAEDIISLAGQVQDMVIVTKEEDRDGICYEPETKAYIRLMGCLNQKLASAADRVVEVVYGIPVLLKPSALGPAAIGSDFIRRECQGE